MFILIRPLLIVIIMHAILVGSALGVSPQYDKSGATQREGAIWYDGKPYYNMGSIESLLATLINDENYDEALFLLDTLEPLYPQNYRLYRYRAETYANMGQASKAADAYRDYFNTATFRDRDSLIKFTTILFGLQKYGEARDYLDKFHNRNGEYYYYYGLTYYREGLFYQARRNFLKVPSGSSYYLSALQLSVESCIALGQYGCARDGYALMSSLIIPGAKSLSESGFLLLNSYKSRHSFYVDARGTYELNPGLVNKGAIAAPSASVFVNYAYLAYPFSTFDIVASSVYVDVNRYLGSEDLGYLSYSVAGLSLIGEVSNEGYRVRPLDLLAELWASDEGLTRARFGLGVQWSGNYAISIRLPISITYNHFLDDKRKDEIGAVEGEGSITLGYNNLNIHHSIFAKGLAYSPVQPQTVGTTSSGPFINFAGGYEGGYFTDRYSLGFFVNQSAEQYLNQIVDLTVGAVGIQPTYYTTTVGADVGVFLRSSVKLYVTGQYTKGLSNMAQFYDGLGDYSNVAFGSGTSLVF